MSTGAIVGIVIAVVVVLALAAFLVRLELRRRRLRDRFGPEYDRIREDRAGRRAAEQELTERERRHAEFGVTPISPMSRDRYTKNWALIQATFVDQPSKAVDEADRLVVTIMQERGYPHANFDERLSMLSVEHGSVLHHYRNGHDIRARHAVSQLSTEDLRTAMVHYRTLIEDLLEARPETIQPRKPVAATTSGNGNGNAARVPRAEPETRDESKVRDSASPQLEDAAERREIDREIESHPDADLSMRPEVEARMHSSEAESNRA
jgi:hypothetical protein